MTIRRLSAGRAVSMGLAVSLAAWSSGHQAAKLVPVIGLWNESVEGEGVVTIDGAKWNGQTPPAEAERAAKALFGTVDGAFVANATSASAFPLAVASSIPGFTAGTMRVQFKLIAGPTDRSAGIVFGLQPSGEYQFVRYNTKDGNLALWGYAKGERRVIVKGEGLHQIPLGSWQELVVTIRGRTLSASVVGIPVLTLRHELPDPPSGRVGVWAKRDVVTSFRGFRSEP